MASELQQGRLPTPVDDVQINICRNPKCVQFGIFPSLTSTRGRPKEDDGYRVIGTSNPAASKILTCKRCGESGIVKNNRAVVEEAERLLRPLAIASNSCPKVDCVNHGRNTVKHPDEYQKFGTTEAGSRRYRCKRCRSTISEPSRSTLRLRYPEKTAIIARLLMNKSPMRRICEVAGVHPMTLYQRIGVIARCAEEFAGRFERPLVAGKAFDHLDLAVDRQDYVFNWGSHLDRRNVILRAIASAECRTGFVFGAHLNYDASLDPNEVELDARARNDHQKDPPFRHYARVWVPYEYDEIGRKGRAKRLEDGLDGREPLVPPVDDLGDAPDTREAKIPSRGMQVHDDYAMYGHFFYLRALLSGAKRLHFSLDRDDTSRAACLVAFRDLISARRLMAFFIRIDKELTVDEKKRRLARSESELDRLRRNNRDLQDVPLALELIKQRHQVAVARSPRWRDRWVEHPLPNMNEPAKAMCCLTDTGDIEAERLAWGYLRTSLNAVDRFFMQLRRRYSLLERPIATSSRGRRLWHGYSGYNPAVAAELIASFRVMYNYTLPGRDKKTPAMRLGLTDRVWKLNEVLGETK